MKDYFLVDVFTDTSWVQDWIKTHGGITELMHHAIAEAPDIFGYPAAHDSYEKLRRKNAHVVSIHNAKEIDGLKKDQWRSGIQRRKSSGISHAGMKGLADITAKDAKIIESKWEMWNINRISIEIGAAPHTVHKYAKSFLGLPRKKNRHVNIELSDKQIEEIKETWETTNVPELARKYKMSYHVLYEFCTLLLKLPPKHELSRTKKSTK